MDLFKSIELLNLYNQAPAEHLEKAIRARHPETGRWVTLNGGTSNETGEHHGTHVYIEHGQITKGPKALVEKGTKKGAADEAKEHMAKILKHGEARDVMAAHELHDTFTRYAGSNKKHADDALEKLRHMASKHDKEANKGGNDTQKNKEKSGPTTLFHGSTSHKIDKLHPGTWFSPKEEFAQRFAKGKAEKKGVPAVYKTHQDLSKLKLADISGIGMDQYATLPEIAHHFKVSPEELRSAYDKDDVLKYVGSDSNTALRYMIDSPHVHDLLKKKGYDGIKAKEGMRDAKDYVPTYKLFHQVESQLHSYDADKARAEEEKAAKAKKKAAPKKKSKEVAKSAKLELLKSMTELEKAIRARHPETGRWVTLNGGTSNETGEHHGTHVFIEHGQITKGPKALVEKDTKKEPKTQYHTFSGGKYQPVQGEKVDIHPDLHTFIHKRGDGYAISHASSGGLLGTHSSTKEGAIKDARENLNFLGVNKIKQMVKQDVDRNGPAPGFEETKQQDTTHLDRAKEMAKGAPHHMAWLDKVTDDPAANRALREHMATTGKKAADLFSEWSGKDIKKSFDGDRLLKAIEQLTYYNNR